MSDASATRRSDTTTPAHHLPIDDLADEWLKKNVRLPGDFVPLHSLANLGFGLQAEILRRYRDVKRPES